MGRSTFVGVGIWASQQRLFGCRNSLGFSSAFLLDKVCIVDDAFINRAVLRSKINQIVTVAEWIEYDHMEKCIEELKPVQLYFLDQDLGMDHMTGTEGIRALREPGLKGRALGVCSQVSEEADVHLANASEGSSRGRRCGRLRNCRHFLRI